MLLFFGEALTGRVVLGEPVDHLTHSLLHLVDAVQLTENFSGSIEVNNQNEHSVVVDLTGFTGDVSHLHDLLFFQVELEP